MDLAEKIKTYRKDNNVSMPDLAIVSGISKENLYKWEKGTKPTDFESVKKLEKILESEWKVLQIYLLESERSNSYLQKRRNEKLKDKSIPVMGGSTNLSNIEVYNDDKSRFEVIGSLPQNVFPGCDYAERAKGDSMYPLIMNQALLVGKQCNKDGMVWGEKYIVKTKTGLDTTKFVHPVEGDESKLELKAHNKSIPPQRINIDDIDFCCRVHWIINPT
jgi:transcriptional regulator with XRE-family HTH domain